MTASQRTTLMARLWPDACAAAGWPVNDRAFRLEQLSLILGRKIDTANDLNQTTDYDRVKSALLAISEPANLNAQVHLEQQPRIRALHALRQLDKHYHPQLHPSPYLSAILRNQHGHASLDRLSLNQIKHLAITLTNRLRKAKAKPANQPF